MTREEAIGYNKNLREYMRITDKDDPECKFLNENYEALDMAIKALEEQTRERGMTVSEIINIIHEQGIENEVFELLTRWMIEDRYNKMVKIGENEAIIRAINKIATQNKNRKQAIDGIISLSESEG